MSITQPGDWRAQAQALRIRLHELELAIQTVKVSEEELDEALEGAARLSAAEGRAFMHELSRAELLTRLQDKLRRRAMEGAPEGPEVLARFQRDADEAIERCNEAAKVAEVAEQQARSRLQDVLAQARTRIETLLQGEQAPLATRDGGQPSPEPSPVKGDQTRLSLSVLPTDGESFRYRIRGPLTYAYLLALKQDASGLDGIRSVSVMPEADGGAVLSLTGDAPQALLPRLLGHPDFSLQLATQ